MIKMQIRTKMLYMYKRGSLIGLFKSYDKNMKEW